MTNAAIMPLKGKALLQRVKELAHLSRREKARMCGYYTVTKKEQPRVNLIEFYDALLAAKDIPVGLDASKDGRGREPTYRVKVHKNGQIVIGSAYTQEMGLKPGDEFIIKLGYKHIHLLKIDSEDEPQPEDASDPLRRKFQRRALEEANLE